MPPSKFKANSFELSPSGETDRDQQSPLLQQLPLAFLPLLLREVIVYDWKFPAERDEIDRQFRYLASLTADQLSSTMSSFAKLKLSPELEAMDWVGAPSRFSERLSAYLWATHQIDDFSGAAEDYIQVFNTAVPEAPAPAPRLGIAVIGTRDQARRTIRSSANCVHTASTSVMSTQRVVIRSYWLRLLHAPRRTPPPMPTGVLTADCRQYRRTTRRLGCGLWIPATGAQGAHPQNAGNQLIPGRP